MGAARYSGVRIILGIVFTIALFTYYQLSVPNTPKMASRDDSSPIKGLEVTLKQTSTSPLTITATVTNKNTHTVTALRYNSPLDPSALRLGLLSITPDGASEPLDLPKIQIRRVWPPKPDSLTQFEPGASKSEEIVLDDEDIVSQLGKKASVVLKGRWDMVWSRSKDSITDEDLAQVNPSPDVFSGDFVSNTIDITTA